MGAFILPSAWLATSLLLASLVAKAGEIEVANPNRRVDATRNDPSSSAVKAGHLGADNTIRDLLSHPAFAGHSHLLMPWSDRSCEKTMRLGNIGSLLPYHSHVDATTVVAGLNHMIDEVSNGRPVFYDIYSEAQKRADPTREQTGLFFFRGKPGAPFAVVSPGGGFSYVGSVHEGFPYALEIAGAGYNAFVLKYRAGQGGAVATEDLAAAISTMFRIAEGLGVGIRDYSLWGSSAGARMAAAIGSHGVAAFGGDELPKPAAVVLAYTAHSDTSSDEPPTFVIAGAQDAIAPPSVMERRVTRLRRAGVEVEYHKYKGLGHGFGAGTGTNAEGWIADATRFWEKFIKNNR
jgi:acetyl esterase/lipase